MAPTNDVGTVLLRAASHAKVMGRHLRDETDGSVRFDWPAVRISFLQLTGTAAVSIRMHAGRSVLGYRVVLHNSQQSTDSQQHEDKVVVCNGVLSCYLHFRRRDYRVASDLDPNKRYDLQIWKQDDPGIGVVQVFGLLVDPGGSAISQDSTSSDSRQPRRKHIEFVGDSDTVGFGNMASKSGFCYSYLFQVPAMLLGVPCVRKTTDATQSFAAFTASKIGADCDYSIIARSGIGAQHSEAGMPENMCSVYDRAIFRDASSKMRSSEGPQPDLVVVYIGHNDLSSLADQETYGVFGSNRSSVESVEGMMYKSFVNLLQKIRRRHPVPDGSSDDNEKVQEEGDAVKIVIVVPHQDAILASVSNERELRSIVETHRGAWAQAVDDMGGADAHIYIVENRHEPQIQLNSRQDFGMMLHWNASSCEKWANGLAPQLEGFLSGNGG